MNDSKNVKWGAFTKKEAASFLCCYGVGKQNVAETKARQSICGASPASVRRLSVWLVRAPPSLVSFPVRLKETFPFREETQSVERHYVDERILSELVWENKKRTQQTCGVQGTVEQHGFQREHRTTR